MEKLDNNQCDEGCYNEYCYRYNVGSSLGEPTAGVDMNQCPWPRGSNGTDGERGSAQNCSDSVSIYLDPNIPTTSVYQPDGTMNESQWVYITYGVCHEDWIGDGYCTFSLL